MMAQVWWLWSLFALVVAWRWVRAGPPEVHGAGRPSWREAGAARRPAGRRLRPGGRRAAEQRVESQRGPRRTRTSCARWHRWSPALLRGRHVNQLERDRAQQFGARGPGPGGGPPRTSSCCTPPPPGGLPALHHGARCLGVRCSCAAWWRPLGSPATWTSRSRRCAPRSPDPAPGHGDQPAGRRPCGGCEGPHVLLPGRPGVPADGSPENEERRAQPLAAHAKALRAHVNTLVRRSTGPRRRTPPNW
ncbi:hypothetical protein QJS66_21235 [Kocuria rhizophila]|nr:hypothetical protein QJS66_21235 [Kocuria rhizophila]